MYSVGDNVVYPCHGAGKIVRIASREVRGRRRDYITIQILHDRMTVMIPVENAERAGLRKVIAAEAVDEVLEMLRGGAPAMPEKWHARAKCAQEKLGTGDILQVAEVVRDLTLRAAGKVLSPGEKQMFDKAGKILASELMYACELSAEEAVALLDDVLGTTHVGGPVPADWIRESGRVA
ncbi:MAG TPA: CarD family transcriptional regulator [Thermoleophilia bacterium]|nr:CarD family transcriptional regulator [Thermoleophilia bacterium]